VPNQQGEFIVEATGSCASHPPPSMCSNINERCTTVADCCPPAAGQQPNLCIAGFCAMLQPVLQ
jgi:hypothetical protein